MPASARRAHARPRAVANRTIADVAEIIARRQGASSYGGSRATVNAVRAVIGNQVTREAVAAALKLTDHDRTAKRGTRHSPRVRGRGDAAREIQRAEVSYRAGYVVNAAERISKALGVGKTMREALYGERYWYGQHELARRNRQRTATIVDAASERWGATLGWHAREDGRTSAECKAADGRNFQAGQRPAIGYPGSVHLHCRCLPGPPFATRETVDAATAHVQSAHAS